MYPAAEIHRSGAEDTEALGIKLIFEGNPLSIYNLYSPPPEALRLHAIQPEEERWIIMGDFNSHSPSWGYPDLDPKGDEVEDWIITNRIVLINRPDEPHTYYSRAWRKISCPDIAIATDDVAKITKRHAEVPTLPFWAEDLPLYVISPVLPFDRKISRWRKLKIFRSFYPFPNCPAIAFFIENSTERERKRAWVKRCCNIYF